jgi:tRNA-specific 2-thiouridylase
MRALALFSGGLDSMLAMKTISDMGIKVTALHMNTGFGGTSDKSAIMRRRAEIAGAEFVIVDIREEYIQKILFDPKHGYGKYFNPCIDCHGYMFKIAKGLLTKYDASFIITGEVLGQRPMSQRAEAIATVTNLAEDDEGLILRPMSAKHMKPTKPELEGWVDREKLYDIKGRSRQVQLGLAKKFDWEDYQSPGGGCLLTEGAFEQKIKDIVAYGKFTLEDIDLLKVGRHLRLTEGAKLVIGRDQEENARLEKIQNSNYISAAALDIPGPLSLISKDASEADKKLAAKLILTYTKTSPNENRDVKFEKEIIRAIPFENKNATKEFFVVM